LPAHNNAFRLEVILDAPQASSPTHLGWLASGLRSAVGWIATTKATDDADTHHDRTVSDLVDIGLIHDRLPFFVSHC
jgi:hypothetical protein